MTAHRDHTNIKRSFQARIGDTLETADGTFPVYHDYAFADPGLTAGGAGEGDEWAAEGAEGTDAGAREDAAWVEVRWLDEMAGGKGYSSAQVDVFSRVGAPTSALRDPMGLVCERLANAVQARFRGVAEPRDNWFVEILDYADLDDPTGTGEYLVVQSDATGAFGEPAERRRHPLQNGLQRVTLTYTVRLVQDAAGAAAFYTA